MTNFFYLIIKTFGFLFCLFSTTSVVGQMRQPEDYGFTHLQTIYKGDTVDILIKSKKGDEKIRKPLFFFCQGSLPQPLIKYDEQGIFSVFPFNTDSLTIDYHLVIVSKPYIPVVCSVNALKSDFTYTDSSGKFPKKYLDRNLLDYYVGRNIKVIKYLQLKNWVSKKELVVAGHSEGSTIAAKLSQRYTAVTKLIYSGGNPLGRILSIVERQRMYETDSIKSAEEEINNWANIVADKTNMDEGKGDTYKATYEFSIAPIQYLQSLKIPVLVCYGTKDVSSPFNDYLRIEMINKKKKNFTFNAYIGTEHNYFPLKPNGEINYEVFNWDKVANDWWRWVKRN
jgi:dienelactone hydrolase